MKEIIEMRKHLLRCHISGFTYYDGCIAFENLKIGTELELVREQENQYDPEAVAVYYQDMKLGFIPRSQNSDICKFLDMDYDNIFEVRISSICADEHPENQVWINIYLKRNGMNIYEDNKR